MPLTRADRVRALEALIADPEGKPTVVLRALEELGRIERELEGAGRKPDAVDEVAPDPFADLDEVEAARAKRAAKRRVA